MTKLTNLNDLVISLIRKSLGAQSFKFITWLIPDMKIASQLEKYVLFFETPEYWFSICLTENGLRVSDRGDVYLIQDTLPDNFYEEMDFIIKSEASCLRNYYNLYVSVEDEENSEYFKQNLKTKFYLFRKIDEG